MKVIAFSGRARCGKSYITNTAARALWDMGYTPVVLPLAAPLKEAAAEAGFPKDTDPEGYRLYCQEHGAAERAKDPDHWLKLWYDMYLDAMMRELGTTGEYVVIVDDVRYPNELNLINQMENSTSIFVSEGSRSATLEDANAEWRSHHSEYLANDANEDFTKYEDDFDYLFVNDGAPFKDLAGYITDGENKVLKAWLGNNECDCILCNAYIENVEADEDEVEEKLIAKLEEYLAEFSDDTDEIIPLDDDEDGWEEDDNDNEPNGSD